MTERNKLNQTKLPLYQQHQNEEEVEFDKIDETHFDQMHYENIRNLSHLTTSKVAEPEMNETEYTESANKLSVSTNVHEAPTPIRTPINQTIDSQHFRPRNVIGADKMARKLTVESSHAANQNGNIAMTRTTAEMVKLQRARDIISEHEQTINMLQKELDSSTNTSLFESNLDRAHRQIEQLSNIVRELRAAVGNQNENGKTDLKVATVHVPEQCAEPGVLRKIWKTVCSKKKKTWKRVAAVCFVVGMTVGTGYCIYMNPMGSFLGATGSIGTYIGTTKPQNAQIQGVDQHDNLEKGERVTLFQSNTEPDIVDGSGLNILFFLAIYSVKRNNCFFDNFFFWRYLQSLNIFYFRFERFMFFLVGNSFNVIHSKMYCVFPYQSREQTTIAWHSLI